MVQHRGPWLVGLFCFTACSRSAIGTDSEDAAPTACSAREHVAFPELRPGDFSIERGWPISVGTMNGKTMRFLLDTGAEGTLVDSRHVEDTWTFDDDGKVAADIEVLGVTLAGHPVVQFDFPLAGWYGVDVVLGADVLLQTTFSIDYAKKRALLGRPPDAIFEGWDAAELGATVSLPLVTAPNAWSTSIHVEGLSVDVLLDTGASVTTVEPSLIDALGRAGRPEVGIGPFQPGQVRVAHEASVVRVREMGVPGAMVEGVPVHVLGEYRSTEPPVFGGLLGWPYFRHFIVVFDGTAGSVTLTPHNDASVAPEGEFVRLGFDVTPGEAGWVVTRLYEGSNAASVLRLGDVVESVDDEPATGDRRAHVVALLSGYERGCEVEVRFRRGAESATVRVEAEQLLPRFED